MYGLKQASRTWYQTLKDFLKKLGFSQFQHEKCLFTNGRTYIAVYVDDLVLASTEMPELTSVKKKLSDHFQMVDLGRINYILGLNIEITPDSITMHQQQYVDKLLETFGMGDCTTCDTPSDARVVLLKEDKISKPLKNVSLYQCLVGSLLYLSTRTRPDIAYAVSTVSKFSHSPSNAHWTAAICILRYLRKTRSLGISYTRGVSAVLQGYSDANHGGKADGQRKSTSGNIFFLAGGPIAWSSKLQDIVAFSTLEAEYVSLSDAGREAVFLGNLVEEFGAKQFPVVLFCDNKNAVALSKDESHGKASKHIDIRYHWIQERVQLHHLKVVWIGTMEMLADIFTKALGPVIFEKLRLTILKDIAKN